MKTGRALFNAVTQSGVLDGSRAPSVIHAGRDASLRVWAEKARHQTRCDITIDPIPEALTL